MSLEALEAFGMGVGVIIYLLVDRGARVGFLATKKSKFLAPGVIALVITGAFYLAQSPKPPIYLFLVKWLGLWVTAMMMKSTVKDGEKKVQ